jgi:hypothetical protein
MTLPLEYIEEYDAAAMWCALRGLKGELGDPLPPNMGSPGAIDYIQADPESFMERIGQCAYQIAMEKVEAD